MQINLRHYTKRVEHDGTIEQKKAIKQVFGKVFIIHPKKPFRI